MFQRKAIWVASIAGIPLSWVVWLALVFGPSWSEPHTVPNIPLAQYAGMSPLEKVQYINSSNLADRTVTGLEKTAYLLASNPLPYLVYWALLLIALFAMFALGVVYARRKSHLTLR